MRRSPIGIIEEPERSLQRGDPSDRGIDIGQHHQPALERPGQPAGIRIAHQVEVDARPKRQRRRFSRSAATPCTTSSALPLTRSGGRIALLGPLADASADMLGSWAADGRPEEAVNILKGLRATFPEREVAHAPGAGIDGDNTGGIAAALNLARAAEVVVLCLGEARTVRRGSSIDGGSIRHEAHGRLEQACGGGTRADMDLEGAGLEASGRGRGLENPRSFVDSSKRTVPRAPRSSASFATPLSSSSGRAMLATGSRTNRNAVLLLSRNVALVRHLDFDREQFTWPKLRGMRTQVAIGKARVGEPVAERELRINGRSMYLAL